MIRDRPFQMRWSQPELDKLDDALDEGQSRADFIRIAVDKMIATKPCTRCKGTGEEPPRRRGKK
jgi:hypothetical protein